jgi:hypothetical protein
MLTTSRTLAWAGFTLKHLGVRRRAGTGSASAQVLASAQSLSHQSGHLKAEVDKFLMTVRAA